MQAIESIKPSVAMAGKESGRQREREGYRKKGGTDNVKLTEN